jgi:hypothetical protein
LYFALSTGGLLFKHSYGAELILNKIKFIMINFAVSIMLTACAGPNVNRAPADFSETEYSADLNLCQAVKFADASLNTIGASLIGTLGGAAIVGIHGAVAAGSPEAIAVGAITGAVIGFGIGAKDAINGYDQEIVECLREKGYEVVAGGG